MNMELGIEMKFISEMEIMKEEYTGSRVWHI